jgi:hypothetical protein
MIRLFLAALVGLALLGPAAAQGYDPYGYRGPSRYDGGPYLAPRQDTWRERRPRSYDAPGWGYERHSPRPSRRFGQICATSRGACYVRPVPVGSRCRCEIPGFGLKRGSVVR